MQNLISNLNLADYILPVVLLVVAVLGVVAKVPLFDSFVKGAAKALKVVAGVFPYLAAVFLIVHLLEACGLRQALCNWLSPLLAPLGVPAELVPLLLIKPLSGSGSLAVLEDVMTTYGADSYIGRCAACMAGCSETVLYVAAVYFGSGGNRRLRYGLPIAFAATLVGALLSCWICRWL